jgi:hypothetical protein
LVFSSSSLPALHNPSIQKVIFRLEISNIQHLILFPCTISMALLIDAVASSPPLLHNMMVSSPLI